MSRPSRRRPQRRRPQQKRLPAETVTIETLGRQGDGEGVLADGTRVFVPFTIPGEVVTVQPGAKRGDGVAAEVTARISGASPHTPVCPLFGRCGGCQVQHLSPERYADWKRGAVVQALARHGLNPEIAPMRSVPLASRRRARLSAVMTQKGLVLGFNAAKSDAVVDVVVCPLFAPALADKMPGLRELLSSVLKGGERADIAVTALGGGATDVLIEADAALDLSVREALAAFTERYDVARISWGEAGVPPEPVLQRRPMLADMAGVGVEMPIGFFQQPSSEGEEILRGLVMDAVGDAAQVADLFSGVGTFALPIAAAGAHVYAADSGAAAIAALNRAAGQAALGGRITAESRDLQARPVSGKALDAFEVVVFDPPRAGAREQAAALAESGVPKIVAVSCNPATMGRDLRLLVDGGYEIEGLTPVDQFPMTYHVEAVAVLNRLG